MIRKQIGLHQEDDCSFCSEKSTSHQGFNQALLVECTAFPIWCRQGFKNFILHGRDDASVLRRQGITAAVHLIDHMTFALLQGSMLTSLQHMESRHAEF